MQTIQHSFDVRLVKEKRSSLVSQFMSWCKSQEEHRYGWLAAMLTIHGCVLFPMVMLAILASGVQMLLISLVIASMTMVLVVNLSAMPTRITIPVFFLSVLIDLLVLVIAISKLFLN